jgi:hypothetical protein
MTGTFVDFPQFLDDFFLVIQFQFVKIMKIIHGVFVFGDFAKDARNCWLFVSSFLGRLSMNQLLFSRKYQCIL